MSINKYRRQRAIRQMNGHIKLFLKLAAPLIAITVLVLFGLMYLLTNSIMGN